MKPIGMKLFATEQNNKTLYIAKVVRCLYHLSHDENCEEIDNTKVNAITLKHDLVL